MASIIAAVSHTVGGGSSPHPLLVLALSVFLTPIAALLVGRTPRIARLAAAVLLSQSVFHVLFHLLGAALGPVSGASVHQHHAMTLHPAPGPALLSAAPDAPMLAAHVVAAVLTTALLWRGEQLLRAIGRWVRASLQAGMPGRLHPPARPLLPVVADRVVVSVLRVGDVSRRGPPALSRG